MGPILGVCHFLACVCEGLANALLHEEAQFAPFEPQRTTFSIAVDPSLDETPLLDWSTATVSLPSEASPPKEVVPSAANWGGGFAAFARMGRNVITNVQDDEKVMEYAGRLFDNI